MITRNLLLILTLLPAISIGVVDITPLMNMTQSNIDLSSPNHSESNLNELLSSQKQTLLQVTEEEKTKANDSFLIKEEDKPNTNRSYMIDETTQGVHLVPIRLMAVGAAINLDAATIEYETQVQLGADNTVTVRTNPPVPGAAIYMNVTDTCAKDINYDCVRLSIGQSNYEANYLMSPISRKQLTDHGNGSYSGTYKVTHTGTGFITVSLYAMVQGLRRVCYNNIVFSEPYHSTRIDSKIQFDWGYGDVCPGLDNDVSLRWKGKFKVTESKTYEFKMRVDTAGELYLDNVRVISTDLNIFSQDSDLGSMYLSAGEHDVMVMYIEEGFTAKLSLDWLYPSSNYVDIPESVFSCAYSMRASSNIKVTCKEGYYIDIVIGACAKCPKGTYNDKIGQYFCEPCPKGTYNNEIESTNLSQCKDCPEGTYNDITGLVDISLCKPCPVGTYNEITRLTEESQCKFCPEGTYNNITGLIDISLCKNCPVGTYNELTGLIAESLCKPCPVGTYSDTTKLTAESQCKFCPEGTYNNITGLTDSSQCKSCPVGTYNDEQGLTLESQCKLCPVGTYNDVTRLVAEFLCQLCPEGSYNDMTGLSASSQCKSCPVGTYNDEKGLTLESQCKLCPEGSYNDVTRIPASSQCKSCPEGTYNDEKGLIYSHQCKLCPKGRYNDMTRLTNVSQCTLCPEGTYNDEIGLVAVSQCKLCQVGTYNDEKGLVDILQCKLCPAGTYNYKTGQVSLDDCLPCPLMTYGDRPGLSHCRNCVAKTYSDELGATSCSACYPSCSRCYGPFEAQCYSCVEDSGASSESENCYCPENQYYDILNNKCTACHALCSTCFGPSSEECYSCNTSIGYKVENKSYSCVTDCEDGYYKSSSTCNLCRNPCKTCTGDNGELCLTCLFPNKVIYNYTCNDSCPINSTLIGEICNDCNVNCRSCKNLARTGCTSCKEDKVLWDGQCVSQCPPGSYLNSNICLPCLSPCATCTSAIDCLSCLPSFYKNGDICVESTECTSGTYPDSSKMSCEPCSKACLTCYGPSITECLKCNYLEKYGRSEKNSGDCHLITCAEGTYLEIDHEISALYCAACNRRCKLCKEYNLCTECKPNFLSVTTEDGVRCENCPTGYFFKQNGCEEICGDGLNLGKYECDDGNTMDGDGCSHDCRIEKDYECYRQLDKPDKCKDVVPPKANIIVIRGNKILLSFNEIVFPTYSSIILVYICLGDELSKHIKIVLNSVDKDSESINWSFESAFKSHASIKELVILTDIKLNIRGTDEVFNIEFDNGTFLDVGKNDLKERKFKVAALRQLQLSNTLGDLGSGLLGSMYITFVMTIGVNPFKSKPSFWIFISMTQVLSYIPVLNCNIPCNLELFLTNYFGVSKSSIPFDSLPTWIPNPKKFIAKFKTEPLNLEFERAGYTSTSFIYNFGDQLSTWIILVLIYALISVAGKLSLKLLYFFTNSYRRKFAINYKSNYKYTSLLRILIVGYSGLSFCSLIDFSQFHTNTAPEIFSLIVAGIAIYCEVRLITIIFRICETPDKEMSMVMFTKKFEILKENIDVKRPIIVKAYYPLYLIRRFLPFNDIVFNGLHIYNEFVIFFSFVFILIINLIPINSDIVETIGLVIIGLVFLSLIITWITLLPGIVKDVIEILKNISKKKKVMIKKKRKTLQSKAKSFKGKSKYSSKFKKGNLTKFVIKKNKKL